MTITYLLADKSADEGGGVTASLAEKLYDLIYRRLVLGDFLPGEAIRQDTLAASLGVSKIPVREALGRLQRAGLVDYVANRGFIAREIQHSEFVEAERVRSIFEAEFVVKRLSEGGREQNILKKEASKQLISDCRARDYLGVNSLMLSSLVENNDESFIFRILSQSWSITDQFIANPSNSEFRQPIGEATIGLISALL